MRQEPRSTFLPAVSVPPSWQPVRGALAASPLCPQGNQSPESPSNFPKVTQLGSLTARILSLAVLTPEAFGNTSACRYSSGQGSLYTSHNPMLSTDCRTSGSNVKQLLPRSSLRFCPSLQTLKTVWKKPTLVRKGRSKAHSLPGIDSQKLSSPKSTRVVLSPPSVWMLSHPGMGYR